MSKIKILKEDRKKYVLKDKVDFQILEKIYLLEKKRLAIRDKELIKFIRTQLEDNWRKPIVKILNKMFKKYEI